MYWRYFDRLAQFILKLVQTVACVYKNKVRSPYHRELRSLLFATSAWVLERHLLTSTVTMQETVPTWEMFLFRKFIGVSFTCFYSCLKMCFSFLLLSFFSGVRLACVCCLNTEKQLDHLKITKLVSVPWTVLFIPTYVIW